MRKDPKSLQSFSVLLIPRSRTEHMRSPSMTLPTIPQHQPSNSTHNLKHPNNLLRSYLNSTKHMYHLVNSSNLMPKRKPKHPLTSMRHSQTSTFHNHHQYHNLLNNKPNFRHKLLRCPISMIFSGELMLSEAQPLLLTITTTKDMDNIMIISMETTHNLKLRLMETMTYSASFE